MSFIAGNQNTAEAECPNAQNRRNDRSKSEWKKDLVISAKEVRDIFLFGVDLTDDSGKEMPDALIEFYIRGAQDWLERSLGGLSLTPIEVDEAHDYYINDYVQYAFIKLFRYPTQCVNFVGVQFPLATNVLKFDPTWYRVEQIASQVMLVPTQGTFSSILLSQGDNFLPLLYQGLQHVPHIMKVSYTAGFEKGKVPPELIEIVGMKAAMGPLNIAGDLIAGAGIATKTISLDGLSQSIGTTSSATNAGYGARIIQYQKQIDNAMKDLRNHYVGIQMVVA